MGLAETSLWQALHDGVIVSATPDPDGSLRVLVEIEYLGELLAPAARGFVIVLMGFRGLELRRHVRDDAVALVSTRAADLDTLDLEIIDASETPRGVRIACWTGPTHAAEYAELLLDYAAAVVQVDDGRPFSPAQVVDLAERYWRRT